MAYHTIVKGDADAAMAGADVVVKSHYVSDASQGVPIEPRAVVAQWQGDKVTIWSSTQVPYAARAGVAQTLAGARGRRAGRRAAPRRRVRREVRPALRGPGRRARPSRPAAGHASSSRARRSSRAIAQRREGIAMEFETGVTRDGRLVARRAKLVLDKGAYCGEGGFLGQMAAMHACGPYLIDAHLGRGLPELHEQPAVRLGPRADGAAGLLGARAAHGRGRRPRSAWIPSSSAAGR